MEPLMVPELAPLKESPLVLPLVNVLVRMLVHLSGLPKVHLSAMPSVRLVPVSAPQLEERSVRVWGTFRT